MDNMLIITFNDGRKLEACLARPFKSQENEIEVTPNGGVEKTALSLDEICSIGLQGKPAIVALSGAGECLEEVETVTGERYQVYTDVRKNSQRGFDCIPAEEDSRFMRIFFTTQGIKTRNRKNGGGEIAGNYLKDQLLQSGIKGEMLAAGQELDTHQAEEIDASAVILHQEPMEAVEREQGPHCDMSTNTRVGDILVAARLVTRDQVEMTLESQSKGRKIKIGALLVERGLISEDQLLTALSIKFRMRFIDLDGVRPSQEALNSLPRGMADQLQVFPIELYRRKLVVATSEPTDSTIVDRLRFTTGRTVELVVARSQQISTAIEKYYNNPEDVVDNLINELHGEQLTIVEQSEESVFVEPDSKVVQLVNRILLGARQLGASDIHFEPGIRQAPLIVRYRVDGECFIAHKIPPMYKSAVISRLKIIANLDIAERRKPQSGKILLRSENLELEYRLEITPTVGGQEDAVLRLLTASKPLPLESMGFSPDNLASFKEILSKPYGIILCVGPTGSGKTTTLHSALAQINSPER